MANRKVSVDEMASAINEQMEEYLNLATDDMKKAVEKTSSEVVKEIQANAPVRTGAYKKSWTSTKTSEDSHSVTYTVHSKNRYQLAHLLEKGHAKRGGGRVAARPHIAPAEEDGEKMLEQLITEALQ